MNPDLQQLHPYPFEKIRALIEDVSPAAKDNIALSIGEPKHPAPAFVGTVIEQSWRGVEQYPATRGTTALRESIAAWLCQRFSLEKLSPDSQVLPINGTREALFAIAQCLLDRTSQKQQVLSPNPFYQIYEGAIYLAGLTPTFYNLPSTGSGRPEYWDRNDKRWSEIQLLYICNPGNPTGQVMSLEELQELVELAEQHNFVIVSDECYSEIYRNEEEPPPGLLTAAASIGNDSYRHCLAFHSLSKRSNLPGLRSGFVAGDAELLETFLLYRTYHGCSMSPPIQDVSIAAWSDEKHVVENRQSYNKKYDHVVPILSETMEVNIPEAGFYLWPALGMNDESFTRDILQHQNISVVPGSYLSRTVSNLNPGTNRTRLALVAPFEKCVEAAERIRYYFQHQHSG